MDDLISRNAVKEEIESLQKENNQLKARCKVQTGGVMCFFCPMECKYRSEPFRTDLELEAGVSDAENI